jgi:hypothetical protein
VIPYIFAATVPAAAPALVAVAAALVMSVLTWDDHQLRSDKLTKFLCDHPIKVGNPCF